MKKKSSGGIKPIYTPDPLDEVREKIAPRKASGVTRLPDYDEDIAAKKASETEDEEPKKNHLAVAVACVAIITIAAVIVFMAFILPRLQEAM